MYLLYIYIYIFIYIYINEEKLFTMINPFPLALMEKPRSWFLLENCVKNTCERVTF